MNVHLSSPELQAMVEQWVAETGRPADELLEDAVTGYFREIAETREMLDNRYDEARAGKVVLLDGEEAFARLMERTEAQRSRP